MARRFTRLLGATLSFLVAGTTVMLATPERPPQGQQCPNTACFVFEDPPQTGCVYSPGGSCAFVPSGNGGISCQQGGCN